MKPPIPSLPRRTVLRGLGSAAVALPVLEAMLPRRAAAQAAPKRYVVSFAGMSIGRDNAGKLTDIYPDRVGADYDLKLPLAPLGPVQKHVSVVTGLSIPVGGPGGRQSGFHKSSLSPLLCGVRAPSIQPNCAGATSDQVLAPVLRGNTRFPFLTYRVQADVYRGGGNVGVISWRAAGQKNDPLVSPALAFNNLFGGFAPPASADPGLARRLRHERSVLDLVSTHARQLEARLGTGDRQRLARHFEEIRELEKRIAALPPAPAAGGRCVPPARPGADPRREISGADSGYSGEDARAGVLTGLLVKAFACDLTRVAALQYTCAQCFMNVEPLVGVRSDLHELLHLASVPGGPAMGQRKVMELFAWHMKHWANLIAGLEAELGPDGRPLIDTTALVFVTEGGLGPSEGKNPASHSTENMLALLAGGRALGLAPGRHVRGAGAHPARVLISAMTALGGPTRLGEVSGRLDGLFA
jgi:hypothetical protein